MEEKTLLEATLCFLIKDGYVILAIKGRNIGKGLWNGYGGDIKPGETLVQALIRELDEESEMQVLPEQIEKRAVVDFHNTKSDGSVFTCRVHVYFVHNWQTMPKSTIEMKYPRPFPFDALPLRRMLPADRIWLPLVLAGKKITAEAWYGPFQKGLLREVIVKEVDSLPN
ncbi:MAG: NUDIX domain-containing protein [bacterium]